ncbi:hypothetical protein B9Z55_026693 [Caenorhabditis nigoni]|uniref:Uncharacterized protein n=1 Tax=Caenorhabditis nigoni TaxID=1611254 RepID=A0A2G5T4E4_9PELO|nr:hypothetical protein B9Z55_026693 [Caenorhabditis nigoni]
MDQRSTSPEFPKSGVPLQDIIPYNPHFRERTSRPTTRPSSTRRISWSREADRVREISPRSEPEPEPTKIFYPPPPRKSNSFSESYVDPEDKYPLPEKMKKKRKKTPKPIKKPTPEPIFEPVYVPTKTYVPPLVAKKKPPVKTKKSKNKDQLIRQQRDQRYKAQKLEQAKRSQIPVSNLRKVQSEINLKSIPKEALMKKSDAGKTKHFNPPRWRHVGDRNRRRQGDKNSRSFASDYYF